MNKAYLYNPANEGNPPEEYVDDLVPMGNYSTISDASVKDLYVSGTYSNLEDFKNILKKLRKGGTITITGPDINEISRCVNTGFITNEKVRQVIHTGENLYSLSEMVGILKTTGLKVTQQRVNHFRFSVSAQRES